MGSTNAYEYYAQIARQVGYSGFRASFWKASGDLSKLNLIHSRREGAETHYYGAPNQDGAATPEARDFSRPNIEGGCGGLRILRSRDSRGIGLLPELWTKGSFNQSMRSD